MKITITLKKIRVFLGPRSFSNWNWSRNMGWTCVSCYGDSESNLLAHALMCLVDMRR